MRFKFRVSVVPNRLHSEVFLIQKIDTQTEKVVFEQTGFLTYDLLSISETPRTVLLLDGSEKAKQALLLTKILHIEYDEFVKQVRDRFPHKDGKTYAYKQMICDIQSEINNPNISAAIYIHGGVPTFATGISSKSQFIVETPTNFGDFEIVIQPSIKGKGYRKFNYNNVNYDKNIPYYGQAPFLECLNINFPRYFKKYYEDAADLLYWIPKKCGLNETIHRIRHIENSIATSVFKKLKAISENPSDPSVQQILTNHGEEHELAVLTRTFLLYLVNELYKILGYNYRNKYKKELQRYTSEFQEVPSIKFILDLFHAVEDGVAPTHLSEQESWSKLLQEFCAFLSRVKKVLRQKSIKRPLQNVVVFFGTASAYNKAVDGFGSSVRLLHYDNLSLPIEEAIWLSSGIITELTSSNLSTQLPIAEQAALMEKQLCFLHDDTLSGKAVETVITQWNSSAFLVQDSSLITTERVDRLQKHWAEETNHLLKNELNDLDILARHFEKVQIQHVEQLLKGWFWLIGTKSMAQGIAHLCFEHYNRFGQKKWRNYLSAEEVKGELKYVPKPGRNLIKAIENVNTNRQLRGYFSSLQHYSFFSITTKKKFRSNLFYIIDALLPTVGKSRKEQLLYDVLKGYFSTPFKEELTFDTKRKTPQKLNPKAWTTFEHFE